MVSSWSLVLTTHEEVLKNHQLSQYYILNNDLNHSKHHATITKINASHHHP
nr:MAG TPA: hypothetical protein [Caudoviricetes sp.]